MEERNEEIMTVPMSAQEITGELMEESAEQAAREDEELAASLREGIGMPSISSFLSSILFLLSLFPPAQAGFIQQRAQPA